VNAFFKSEKIDREGPWHSVHEVERATLEWVAWWNHERVHSALGYVPPAEFEESYELARTAEAA